MQAAAIIILYALLLCLSYPDISVYARTLSDSIGGFSAVKRIWYSVAVAHALEGVYTLSLCKKHRTPLLVGVSLCFTAIGTMVG